MNLFIYKYNNYYNRIVKKENTLAEYGEPIHSIIGCKDFTPNDGVNTQHIFGSAANNYDGSGDYLIVATDDGTILSRWFVIETQFTRQGQWKITMHRDLVVDYYDDIVNAPCFIEKATLNADSPFIFNSEAITVNQIKTSETLLKDKSGCAWIVGYYAKNTPNENLRGTVNINLNDGAYDIEIDRPFANWKFNATTSNFYLQPTQIWYRIYGKNPTYSGSTGYIEVDTQNGYRNIQVDKSTSSTLNFNNKGTIIGRDLGSKFIAQKDTIYSQLVVGQYAPITSQEDALYFLNLQDKVIKDSTGAFYSIHIEPVGSKTVESSIGAGALFNTLNSIVQTNSSFSGSANSSTFKVVTTAPAYKMTAVELFNLETTWDMTAAKLTTEDAPYNIFAIPFGETTLKDNMTNVLGYSTAQMGMATINSIVQKMTPSSSGGYLYDVQLLPYCPIDILEDGVIEVKSLQAFSGVLDSDNNLVTYILNIPTSKFTKNIYLEQPITITNAKMQSECDVYKLCSPNWASEFQFNAAKNGGVTYFNIDCEYKPYTPYIHINPNFGKLYGRDFDDARGLILSGDFSLTQTSDAWQQYQIQNKNFQNIFDRQIQNMELTQGIQRKQEIVGMIAGVGQGAAAGALTGSMIAPGIGTAVGAIGGAAASLAGGIGDIAFGEQLRNEALDYTKDMFGYQLGNIQALPYTLTKVSAYNNNNKIFPVLEYYTCTDVEKEALAQKIAWNGMTVMVIGTIANYIGNAWSYNNITSKGYIKGKIIRIEDLDDEFHLLKNISDEIYKGVYF